MHNLPIGSSSYRPLTDDQISPHARILGDTLFGGPTGFLSSIANVLYEEIAGEDVVETVIALFTGEDEAPQPPQFAGAGGAVSAAGALPETPPGPLEAGARSEERRGGNKVVRESQSQGYEVNNKKK